MTDIELIKEVLSGRKEYYAELVKKYQHKVIVLCASLLSSGTQAEDAAQEVFLKAFKALSSFRNDALFSTWLYRIAANHCKDLRRKTSREHTESLDQLLEQEGEKIHKIFQDKSDLAQSAENAELINRILEGLPEQYREILILRETQGLSYLEIAGVMKCSIDSVKAKLRRARSELVDKMRHFS